jgi:protein-S-isoprenylcysteine O-methyltransferase Ste14
MGNNHLNNKKLMLSAVKRLCLGIIILGLFLFLCGGDIYYWNAWLYLIALSVSIFSFGVYLYINDKELLQKRLNTKEKEKEQKAYTYIAGISFIATFGVCGLDYRFNWSHVSVVVVIIALFIMLAGFGLFVLTLIYNRFASRVVEIQNNQKIINTGVYAVIRHPMYTAAIIMFFSSPIVLGSYYAAIPMLFFLIGIIFRIRNEEKVLCNGLEGYVSYMKKVRYRLIPFVW